MELHELERKRMLKLLLYLLGGKKHASDIVKEVGGSRSTPVLRLKELVKAGLVKKTVSQEYPYHVYYELTPKGVRIARKLKEIDEILKEGERGG